MFFCMYPGTELHSHKQNVSHVVLVLANAEENNWIQQFFNDYEDLYVHFYVKVLAYN